MKRQEQTPHLLVHLPAHFPSERDLQRAVALHLDTGIHGSILPQAPRYPGLVMCRLGLGLILCFEAPVWAAAPDSWAVAKSSSFEVYSQSGAGPARAGLQWLEQVRAFFATQTGLEAEVRPPVRVIGFASRKEYDSYRITPIADAFYIGTESRDYIVLPSLAPDQFRSAAHEYAHVVIHAAGFHPPRWLDDGFAEVMSTVRFTEGGTLLGAEVPAHRQALRAGRWIALGEVFARVSRTRPIAVHRRFSTPRPGRSPTCCCSRPSTPRTFRR